MPRLLIMEGNTRARQAEAAAMGVPAASDIYSRAIHAYFPDIVLDVIHAAERGAGLKAGVSYGDYDGLVISGSGLHACDTDFAVRNQIDLLCAFARTGKPVLGSCWGLQIAAIAAGGKVRKSPRGREVGVARKITLNEAGRVHRFFTGKPNVFDALCVHYDEVDTLPDKAVVLSANRHSAIQSAIIPLEKSHIWAVQYHPEYDLAQIAMTLRFYQSAMIKDGFFKTIADFDAYLAKLDILVKNPQDKACRWQLGLDETILDERLHRAEIINWIEACVLK